MARRSFSLLVLGAIMLLASALAAAQSGQRIALVIGNGAYADAPLENPVKDAHDVGARLTELGFDVLMATDADLRTMQSRFLEFTDRIEPGATAMVYYAGHGIQANGRNYLLPVDATFQSEQMLRFEALDVSDILEELERSASSINLVMLDACRNNPFEAAYRGGARGLAVMDAAVGTLIAYATAPGSVASDGDDGANGLYTREFLHALEQPGLKVEEVFKQVRVQVSRASRGKQIPWESSSLTGDFVFNASSASAAATTPAAVVVPQAAGPAPDTARTPRPDSLCADLSGRWVSRNEATGCGSEFWLKKTSGEQYEMRMHLCNVAVLNTVTGDTVVDGTTMTTKWKSASCSGTTTIRLAGDCRAGAGEALVTSGLLFVCGGRGPFREEVEFIGVDVDGGAP